MHLKVEDGWEDIKQKVSKTVQKTEGQNARKYLNAHVQAFR